uniref:Uncharacterized protein n=1 Tax=Kalanchoe fedtschenkoi TaxID=63787 RepID=A0A7N0UC60_KALFE
MAIVSDEFEKLVRKMKSLLPQEDFEDVFRTMSRYSGEAWDSAEVGVLRKKVRYLFRDHPSLITEWNSVYPRDLHIEQVDEAQREAYGNLERRLGEHVSLVNDVKHRLPDGRDYRGFLEGVARNAREANAAERIYKDGVEALEGFPELMRRLVDLLELPERLGEDGESAHGLSAEELAAATELMQLGSDGCCRSRESPAAEITADEQAAAEGLMLLKIKKNT